MESYLIGNDLWDVTSGESMNLPTDPREKTRWNAKVGKALYALKQLVDDDTLIRISNIETSKEAWGIFGGYFSKKNTPASTSRKGDWKLGERKTLYCRIFP